MGVDNLFTPPYKDDVVGSKHQKIIDEFGGKATSLIAQMENGNEDLLMPPGIIKVENIESGDFEITSGSHKPKIVRPSAVGDENGLVDILPTIQNVSYGDLHAGIHKRMNTPEQNPNLLVLLMYQNKIGLSKIAEALGVEVSHDAVRALHKSNDVGYYHATGEIDPQWAGPLIEQHIENSEAGNVHTFFMSQPPLNINFEDKDIRELEYGSPSSNKLIEVIQRSKRNEIMRYAKYWDGLNDYSGASSVTVQDMADSNIRGSIVEHPNLEGHYLINLVKTLVSQLLVNNKGEIVSQKIGEPIMIPVNVDEIIRMKARTRKAGFINETHSSQVEFGFNGRHLKFFQERAFLPFDFKGTKPSEYKFNRFGNPEKHGNLRIVNLADPELDPELFTDGVPSAYIPTVGMIMNGIIHSSFFPNNMKTILIGGVLVGGPNEFKAGEKFQTFGGDSLEHNTYRYVLKAGSALMDKDENFSRKKTGEMIQL